MDLESKLEEVEGEYRAGELTESGYRKRKLKIEKEILKRDYEEGDLTEDGYHRKMARLEALPSNSSDGAHVTTPSRQITQDLSNPNEKVKENIKELFGRKHPPLPKRTTKPKNCVSKPLPLHRKKVTVACVDDKTFSIPTRKARDKLVEEGKIREVYIGKAETEAVIINKISKLFPTSSQFLFLKATSGKDLIPATFSDDDIKGDTILELLDGNNLYVRAIPPAQHCSRQPHACSTPSGAQPHAGSTPSGAGQPHAGSTPSGAGQPHAGSTPFGAGQPHAGSTPSSARRPHAGSTSSDAGQPPPPVQHSARPAPSTLSIKYNTGQPPGSIQQIASNSAGERSGSSTGGVHQQFIVGVGQVYATVVPTPKQFNKDVLIEQLHDDHLYTFWRDQSGCYQIRTCERLELEEEDPPVTDQELEEIKLKGATLLHKDFQVYQWLKWRDERGFSKLKDHGAYVQVTMDEMDDFYSFKSANFTPGKVELPNKELLQYYMKAKGKYFPVIEKYGQKFVSMSVDDVDRFCKWIDDSRRKGDFPNN